MSKLILLAFYVMYGVRARNETRQGSAKKVFRCRLVALKLSDQVTIDKHKGVYLTWQL